MDRLIVFAIGIGALYVAWLIATRDYWSDARWRTRANSETGGPHSRTRRWVSRFDEVVSRVLPSLFVAAFGVSALIVSLLGLLE
jgi:hypothetical protein